MFSFVRKCLLNSHIYELISGISSLIKKHCLNRCGRSQKLANFEEINIIYVRIHQTLYLAIDALEHHIFCDEIGHLLYGCFLLPPFSVELG